ncbi:prenyltransferase [Actinomadura alba]|uniref:Prenyltransferase n=1 Tax=Actinomadura alba TaxID=406431 RepID=A0ABR7LU92_9ACTN|nr:prenyltransferase [Actinomadura alba]MBC6468410.1 prenyltransferase [Actinomadura alba]
MEARSAVGPQTSGPAPARGQSGSAVGLAARISAYARLAKIEFVRDYSLASLVVLAALAAGPGLAGHHVVTLLLFLAGQTSLFAVVATFDDVTGYKDGSDKANYVAADGTPLRPLRRKPLLTGELTLRQVERFGYLALLCGTALWTLTIVQSAHAPWWAVLAASLCLLAGVQYSWGLKLSYRGFGEVLVAGCPFVMALAPYGLAAGDLPALALVGALLFGHWQMLVSAYSNTKDISGDKAVNRSTVAVRASERGNHLFIGVLSLAEPALIFTSAAVGWAPWWFSLTMLPVLGLRIRQYTGFLRTGDALLARKRGMAAFRVGVVCLITTYLILMAT